MNRDTATRARSGAILLGLALLVSACSASAAAPAAPAATATAAPAAPAATPTVAPSATPAGLHVAEADGGRTLSVPVGSEVTIELGSTYWQMGDSSDPAVLALASGPTASAAAMGACVPGGGCGTVTAVYRAIAPGTAIITASRTSCGEAMQCTGTAGAYEVTIVVGG